MVEISEPYPLIHTFRVPFYGNDRTELSTGKQNMEAGDGRRGYLAGDKTQVYTTSHESAVLGNTASACAFGPKRD